MQYVEGRTEKHDVPIMRSFYALKEGVKIQEKNSFGNIRT
jgi:hypothetical protein